MIPSGRVIRPLDLSSADVAELADAQDSKSCDGDIVWVRVPPSAVKGVSIMKKMRKTLIILLALALVCSLFAGCGSKKADKSKEETKTEAETTQQEDKAAGAGAPETGDEKVVRVIVTHKDESKKEFEYTTDLEMLGDLLESESLAEGIEGEMGLYITTVDGEKAEDKNQEWWKILQNNEMAQTGADTLKMQDGDVFELVFTTGYY